LTVLNNGDADLDIEVNGSRNAKKAIGAHVFHGAPGDWEVRGFKNGRLIRREVLTLNAGEERHLAWNANDDFFTPLFTGKDLTGWKTHPEEPGDWTVKDGELVGNTGGAALSHLYTERGDFADFHLRVEVKINKDGDSGVHFHCTPYPEFDLELLKGRGKQPLGYEANISKSTPVTGGSGSVWRLDAAGKFFHKKGEDVPIEADTWFLLEIVMRGNHIVTKVNGTTVEDFRDAGGGPAKGHFALQANYAHTKVHFRKIEVKELPPSPPLDDHARLQGDWVAESGEVAGKQLPPVKVESTLRFQRNKLSMTWPGGKDDDLTFELDTKADPKKIDVISSKKRDLGIYRFDGDRLVLGIGDPNDRPADFTTKAGTNRQVIVFKRAP